jgi:hypothetical protein
MALRPLQFSNSVNVHESSDYEHLALRLGALKDTAFNSLRRMRQGQSLLSASVQLWKASLSVHLIADFFFFRGKSTQQVASGRIRVDFHPLFRVGFGTVLLFAVPTLCSSNITKSHITFMPMTSLCLTHMRSISEPCRTESGIH